MKQGIGEIHIYLIADLPAGNVNRRFVFENHHLSGIGVYLVNSVVPCDRNIQITAQHRDENQSFYQLDFVQQQGLIKRTLWPNLSGFAGAFRLGARHIAEGTDHLLFLLALLLPAPLLACGVHWGTCAGVRGSLVESCRSSQLSLLVIL
jgi:HupE / UreJ protein